MAENKIQEKNIICPYCDSEDRDSWEHRDESGVVECDCGKNFYWSRDVRVTYDSKMLCEENNEPHQWIEFDHSTPERKCKGKRCNICDRYEFEK